MDGTEGRQDSSKTALGHTSGGTKGTSQAKGKSYTDAEITTIKSDAAAEAGRLRKAAEQERDALKEDLQSATGRLDNLEREINESRLAEARGDPAALRIHQREQAIATRERAADAKDRDVSRREAQVKAGADALATDKSVVAIAYIAAKHGLETELLESLDISDPEKLEKVAAALAAAKPKETTEDGEEVETELEIDSGLHVGGPAGIKVLAKANEDFAAGKITEAELKVIASKHSND